jgi:phosphate transport system substrate-binding protein
MGALEAPRIRLRAIAWWGLALLLSTLLVRCSESPGSGLDVATPEPILLRAAGSGALQPLLEDLLAAHGARAQEVSLDLLASNSELGWEAAAAGEADLGLVSWGEAPPDAAVQTWRVARDGIGIVVHPSNPLDGLSLLQARELFSGRVWEWRGVGAEQTGVVQVVSREEGSGTRAAFEALVMEDLRVTPAALVMPSGRSVLDYVAEHPGSIGYVSMGLLSERVKVLKVEGELPTPSRVAEGRYPLSRDLLLVAGKPVRDAAHALAEFALSPAGQEIVGRRYGRVR